MSGKKTKKQSIPSEQRESFHADGFRIEGYETKPGLPVAGQ